MNPDLSAPVEEVPARVGTPEYPDRSMIECSLTTQRYFDEFLSARCKSSATQAEADLAFQAGKPPSVGTLPATVRAESPASAQVPSAAVGLQIYCDGGCDPNPGKAGSGIAVYRDGTLGQLWYGLYHPNGTNNTAELNALYHALQFAEEPIVAGETVQILCDSLYSINCVSIWAAGWEKKGWRKRKAGGRIKNLSLIQAAYAVYARIESRVQLTHVSAHVGTEGNELADRMAKLAIERGNEDLRLYWKYGKEIDIQAILRMRAG